MLVKQDRGSAGEQHFYDLALTNTLLMNYCSCSASQLLQDLTFFIKFRYKCV